MKSLYIIIALFLFVLFCFFISEMNDNQSSNAEENMIEKCTGYGWSDFAKSKESGGTAKFYFLANELNSLKNIYSLVDRSFVINPADIRSLNLQALDYSDNSKQNIDKLIDGIENIYKFLQRNDLPVEKQIERLSILKKHFEDYKLPAQEIQDDECEKFLLGLLKKTSNFSEEPPEIKNYQELLTSIIKEYNYFLDLHSLIL